jgi:L,D-peptidoglycan transpeptidase YkuD (ErfK/YbiS/YcfS/YnhG family)
MRIILKNKESLLYDDFVFKCCVGKKGISSKKIEGDMKTPRGIFSLGPLYFRKDKIKNPITKLKKITIKKSMGWCDDSTSKHYNKLIKINNDEVSYENLFQKSNIYDLLIPIHYNTNYPKKNKGSAIFIHLTNNYKKTLGCIALKKKDFLILLKLINKETKIHIL